MKRENKQIKQDMNGNIIVAGLGPGDKKHITPAVTAALKEATAIVGYKYYFEFLDKDLTDGKQCIDTGMKKEIERAAIAFDLANKGERVVVISSGDSGIYGMAPLIIEMQTKENSNIDVEILPGISAFQAASAALGAAISHDFCAISLSDLLTPWEKIEKRIEAAAIADFVTAIYNPKSKGRYWQLNRLVEIFLKHRDGDTPVGVARQVGREDQHVTITTLNKIDIDSIDMFTTLVIGNSQTYTSNNKIITPRGYYKPAEEDKKPGQKIMSESFRTILDKMKSTDHEIGKLWTLLHCIHTSADFEMEDILVCNNGVIESIHNQLIKPGSVIISDVTMVQSGIRKGALERLGIETKCYLNNPKTTELANEKGITRTQAGIRLAVEEHPDALFVFGNAPTALIELTDLIRKGKAKPMGIIAAPVGFVNVNESKHRVKCFNDINSVIIEGNKGGSTLAATIVNSILCYDDAQEINPGRDL